MSSKDLETVPEIIAEFDEIAGIYKRLFFLIPDLFEKQSVSPYAKDPRMSIEIRFDERKFAYRCLIRSILDENEDETGKIDKIQTLLH